MPQPRPVSLKQVAEQANVSAMTVSRVLRQSPQVSPETREQVLRAVKQTGYHPDPFAAQLMERMRRYKQQGQQATLALVHDHSIHADGLHHYVTSEDLQARAGKQGYRIDTFRIGPEGLSAKRLQTVLRTRGIQGILLSVSTADSPAAQLDYGNLAAVTFGFGLSGLPLHRTSTNVTQGMLDVFLRLEQRGYRRIGIAITPWADFRAGHTYSGALLHHQQSLPASRRVPLLLLPHKQAAQNRPLFETWLRKYRPDVLISIPEPILDWLAALKLRVPEDIGLFIHDWVPSMDTLCGMNHRRNEVAAAAIDLLTAHLHHYEYGLPEAPRQILIPPTFVEGPSLRPA